MSALANVVLDGSWRGRVSEGVPTVRRKCLVAGRAYAAGEPVFALDHVTWRPEADEETVAHPNGRYFRDPLLAGVIQSADPNCRLSFELMVLIARRDIQPGEVISGDFVASGSGLAPSRAMIG
jgi:hypothetical protein